MVTRMEASKAASQLTCLLLVFLSESAVDGFASTLLHV